ncbi:hypothetical protein DFH29DRAFT_870594 [Suillus ampliporus]|nr:hypothetical protein DFH29DRAFT_870594 [Suillus ampliporus]
MSDSETEPESDVPSSPKKVCPLDPTDVSTSTLAQLVNTPKTDSPDPISAVNSAVKTLESLDFSLIRKDASLHGAIQESSTALLEFLHVVLTTSPTSAQDVRRMMESLAHIRRLVQELKTIAVVPIVISWVDAVLAKLGDVVSCVASAIHDRDLDNDLPEDRWDSIPSILTSEKASPAAKRLALRLLVSRYVLHPQLILHPRVADAQRDDK